MVYLCTCFVEIYLSIIEVPRDARNSKSENMTSSGENGLNIRTNTGPKMGQDQVSGRVSVLCWLPTIVAMFYENLRNLVIRSKSVIRSSSIRRSQIGFMSDQLRVSLYMVMSQNSMYHFGERETS